MTGKCWFRLVGGRPAFEFEVDSNLSHLIYLTSKPLDRCLEAPDGQKGGLDHVPVVDPSVGFETGHPVEDRGVTLERLIDQLRDIFLKWPHAGQPNRSGGEGQGSLGGEPTGEHREDRQIGMEPDPVESTDVVFAEGSYREWRATERERSRLNATLAEEQSNEAVAGRLRAYAAEFSAIHDELVSTANPVPPFNLVQGLENDYRHITARVNSELRRYDLAYLNEWRQMPPDWDGQPRGQVDQLLRLSEFAVEQLRDMAPRIERGEAGRGVKDAEPRGKGE